MMAMVDDAVGTVLDTLDRLGMSDNTILMFTSDHADLLGDHGLVLKGPFHFQGLVRGNRSLRPWNGSRQAHLPR